MLSSCGVVIVEIALSLDRGKPGRACTLYRVQEATASLREQSLVTGMRYSLDGRVANALFGEKLRSS